MAAKIRTLSKIANLTSRGLPASLSAILADNRAADARAEDAAARLLYREQLARLTRAMSQVDCSQVGEILSPDSSPELVQFFLEGNLEKRCEKLEDQLSFVADAFDDFPQLVDQYVLAIPSAAYDTVVSDADRLLNWLAESLPLTLEQNDHVVCQRARHAVEVLAQTQRLQHVRFQERFSLIDRWLADFGVTSRLRLYLNPIRAWAKFESGALLDNETSPPAQVLFFPRDGEISSAVLELEGQALINELADFQPCTLSEWGAVSHVGNLHHLLETTRALAGMGLIALG